MRDDLHEWVHVEFYAQVPVGQTIISADTVEISRNLMQIFGFTMIDNLVVKRVQDVEN